MGLNDSDHSPDGVEDIGMRIVHVLPLSHGEKAPITFQGFLNSFHGPGPTGGNGNGYAGIDHGVPEGKNRE
jgi:hypothetical protein